jgi:hypothetical protein
MNTKNLIAAAIVSACASTAFAANTAQVDFANTAAPYEVTAQTQAASAGSDAQARNANAGQQTTQTPNFTNSMEPSAVTAQSGK